MIFSCQYSSSTLYITHSQSRLCFAYSCISSVPFQSETQVFRLRIAVHAFFEISVVNIQYSQVATPGNEVDQCYIAHAPYFPIKYTIYIYIYIYIYIFESKEYCSHLPQLVNARGFEPMKKYYVQIFRINKTIIHLKYFALSDWL